MSLLHRLAAEGLALFQSVQALVAAVLPCCKKPSPLPVSQQVPVNGKTRVRHPASERRPLKAATVDALLQLPEDTLHILYTGADDIEVRHLDHIFKRFRGLQLLIFQHGSGISSLPPSVSLRPNLRCLILSNSKYEPYMRCIEYEDAPWVDVGDGVDSLRLVGVKAVLPDKLGSITRLGLAGPDVGRLLLSRSDLGSLEVLELRHWQHLPGHGANSLTKLVGLRHLIIRECPDLELPELGGLRALQKLKLCGPYAPETSSPGRYGWTDLSANIGSLTSLQHLILVNLPSLRELQPATLSGLRALTGLEVVSCGLQVPEAISKLTELQSLSIRSCPNVTALPPSISALGKLTSLRVDSAPLTTVPHEIGALRNLETLKLTGCHQLVELPASIGRLRSLRKLCITSAALTTIPESVVELPRLTVLSLRSCRSLVRLPRSIGNLCWLNTLSLVKCHSLRRLPASVRQLTCLQHAPIWCCNSLSGAPPQLTDPLLNPCAMPPSAPWERVWIRAGRALGWIKPKEWTAAEVLRWVADNGTRQAIITKLVREQEAMLTTLERLSWLVVLLATATFMAYMQPPGGISQTSNLVMATEEWPCSLQLPAWRGTGNHTQEQVDFRKCAAAWFFVLDGLSFGLSLGCITVITLLSFPRLPYLLDSVEAGRFWLALLVTWLMFYLAVLTGFGAFLFSGLASYNQLWVVLMPAVPGMLTMLVVLVFFCLRFSSIFPGWEALKSVIIAIVVGADVKEPDEDEGVMEQLVGSHAFWVKLQHTLGAAPGLGVPPSGLPGAPSSTSPLQAGAEPRRNATPPRSARGAGEAAMSQQAQGFDHSSLLQPQPSSSTQGAQQQLGGSGSSSASGGNAGATDATSGHGSGAGSDSSSSSGGVDGGGDSAGGSGSSPSTTAPGSPTRAPDQGSPLQVVPHPGDLNEIQVGTP